MPNYNKLTIIGHLGRNPETKATQNGTVFSTFPVACTEYKKKTDGTFDENTTWFDCRCYDKFIAEKIMRGGYGKGTPVMIAGPVSCRAYAAKDGSPKVSLSIMVREFVSLASKAQGGAGSASPAANPYSSGNAYSAQHTAASSFAPDPDEDMPF